MPARKPVNDDPCPVLRSLAVIGDRWSLLILRDAFDGLRRFGDFQRSLGVARNILSDRLHKLVGAGILKTQNAQDGSAYQEYVLTGKGEGLFPVLVALRQWGEAYLFQRGQRHSVLIDRHSGQPVPGLKVLAADGSLLPPEQTEVRKVSK